MNRTSKQEPLEGLNIRLACEADIADVENMVNDFVKGHPAEKHARSRSALREAYFGDAPVANLVVAVRDGRVIGMGQWTRIYDMFWSMYGGNVEWLYVRPEHRGSGVVVAIVAEISAHRPPYTRVSPFGRGLPSICGLGRLKSSRDSSQTAKLGIESSASAFKIIGHDSCAAACAPLPIYFAFDTLPIEENLRRIERRQTARAIDEREFEHDTLAEERRALERSGLGTPFDVSAPPAELVLHLLALVSQS